MKVKQYSVKVFELDIEDEGVFLEFLKKHVTLLRHYLVVLNGEITPAIKEYCENENINYSTSGFVKKQHQKDIVLKQNDLKIIDEVIRSGREIRVDSDLLVLNRINSGSRLVVSGNLIITGKIEGLIECNGDFMLLRSTPKARIIFNDQEIELPHDKFHKVSFNGADVIITPLSKELFWA